MATCVMLLIGLLGLAEVSLLKEEKALLVNDEEESSDEKGEDLVRVSSLSPPTCCQRLAFLILRLLVLTILSWNLLGW